MKNFFRRVPSFVLHLLLAAVYLGCGLLVGYHRGYRAGQEDYIVYVNKLFEQAQKPQAESP